MDDIEYVCGMSDAEPYVICCDWHFDLLRTQAIGEPPRLSSASVTEVMEWRTSGVLS